MSDSDENQKPGVPQWQLDSKTEVPADASESTAGTQSRETMIEQARKFLQEDDVRNATTDKKIAFLESKGLLPEEIKTLLGVTRNEEASSTSPQVRSSPWPSCMHN